MVYAHQEDCEECKKTLPEARVAALKKALKSPKLDSLLERQMEPVLFPLGFVRNEKLLLPNGKYKLVDFLHADMKLVIEIDGVLHFKGVHGEKVLERIQSRDQLLDDGIMEMKGWRLIRLDYKGFNRYRGLDIISSSQLRHLIYGKDDKIIRIGVSYGALSLDLNLLTISK